MLIARRAVEKAAWLLAFGCAGAFAPAGCGTYSNLAVRPEPYGGILEAYHQTVGEEYRLHAFPVFLCAAFLVDMPLSFAGDTLTLPFTVAATLLRGEPPTSPVRMPLADANEDSSEVTVEFSRDSRLVSLYHRGGEADGHHHVFDLQGNPVEAATDERGQIKEPLLREFPGAFQRALARQSSEKDAFWSFSPDGRSGLKLTEVACRPRLEVESAPRVELWDLAPARLCRWQVTLPENPCDKQPLLGFFQQEGRSRILVALRFEPGLEAHPGRAFLLSAEDGQVLGEFGFSREAGEGESPDAFEAEVFAFDAERRLLACGGLESAEVRVFSLDSPGKVLFGTKSAGFPRCWSIEDLRFVGDFLVIGRRYRGGRDFSTTRIFRVGDWTRTWEEDSPHVESACASSDGTQVAFLRNGALEIAPLVSR